VRAGSAFAERCSCRSSSALSVGSRTVECGSSLTTNVVVWCGWVEYPANLFGGNEKRGGLWTGLDLGLLSHNAVLSMSGKHPGNG
jgi:hypothetical protein